MSNSHVTLTCIHVVLDDMHFNYDTVAQSIVSGLQLDFFYVSFFLLGCLWPVLQISPRQQLVWCGICCWLSSTNRTTHFYSVIYILELWLLISRSQSCSTVLQENDVVWLNVNDIILYVITSYFCSNTVKLAQHVCAASFHIWSWHTSSNWPDWPVGYGKQEIQFWGKLAYRWCWQTSWHLQINKTKPQTSPFPKTLISKHLPKQNRNTTDCRA